MRSFGARHFLRRNAGARVVLIVALVGFAAFVARVRQRNAFFQYLSPLVVQLWPPASIRRNVGLRVCASWTRFEP